MTYAQNKSYIDIQGRKKTVLYSLYPLLCASTFGVLYMLAKYFPLVRIYLTTRSCSLREADCVLVKEKNKKPIFKDVIEYKKAPVSLKRYVYKDTARVIDLDYSRFIYDYALNRFLVCAFSHGKEIDFDFVYETRLRGDANELREREILFGRNIHNLNLKPISKIILDNTFSLSLLVNILCIVLWFNINYKLYGSVIALMVAYDYVETIYSEIKYKWEMEGACAPKTARVLRGGRFVEVNSEDVYPGDLIYLEPCKEFFCDAIVLRGDVITDESFLTGECVPICKSSSEQSVVFSGTSILKSVNDFESCANSKLDKLCRVRNLTKKKINEDKIKTNRKLFDNHAIGMITVTGFKTTRGQIMKDILNPKPVKIPFLEQAYKSIIGIVALALVLSFPLLVYFHFILKWSIKDNFIFTFDLFFTLATPALAASLSVGIRLSSRCLKQEGVFCNNLDRIYLTGDIDKAVFDKTGTLTSEGMEFYCVDNLSDSFKEVDQVDFITRMGLSTCHSVCELDGKYSGDFLDIKMFIFSGSALTQGSENVRNVVLDLPLTLYGPFLKDVNEENEMVFYQKDKDDCVIEIEPKWERTREGDSQVKHKVDIIKTYEFSSDLRRLSVIVRHNSKNLLFCKGSPDVIGERLKNKPEDFEEKVREYSANGYRVIAMGYRELDTVVNREEDERNLEFLCLIVFSNFLKPESKGVVGELKEAGIAPVICTGDNILTAISVGRECGIIENDVSVIFPIVGDNCQSVYDVEWVCLGDEELIFDKVRLNVYKNNYDDICEDFVVACEGKEYEFFRNTDNLNFILEKGVIFGRFTPGQKKRLVGDLRARGGTIMFCGDGANDSGALSSADVGVALAQNEASLASSFYTKSLERVPILLKEGRCAYVTSIARFKFVCISYMLSYACLVFLVLRNLFLSDIQTLVIDIFIIVPFLYIISNFKRADTLSYNRPDNTILGYCDLLPFVLSLIGQLIVLGFLSSYGEGSESLEYSSKAGTLVFFVSALQSVLNGLYLSDCTPHRESIHKNRPIVIFSALAVLSISVLLFLTYFDTRSLIAFFLFTPLSTKELIYIIVGTLFSVVFCYICPSLVKHLISKRQNKLKKTLLAPFD